MTQTVEKAFFDSLTEAEGAPKRSKPNASAYRWYGSVRFAHEVKMSCCARIVSCFEVEAVLRFFCTPQKRILLYDKYILTVWGFFDTLKASGWPDAFYYAATHLERF